VTIRKLVDPKPKIHSHPIRVGGSTGAACGEALAIVE
jgi:hypothetical protein